MNFRTSLLCVLILRTTAFGGTGDISSIVVTDYVTAGLSNDGWYVDVEVEGFDTGMEVDLGSGFGNDLADGDIPTIVFRVVSEGFMNGALRTQNRTLYATKVLRKPFPEQAEAAEYQTANGTSIRLALNEFIYHDDRAGGAGTSGTDPVCSISAGAFRNFGGGNERSKRAIRVPVTNHSTAPYPKVIATWDFQAGEMNGNRVVDDFRLVAKCEAGHGIDSVRFDALGLISGATKSVLERRRQADVRTATGLWDNGYCADVRLHSFAAGETIACHFEAFPQIGDESSVASTYGNTDLPEEILGRNEIKLIADPGRTLQTVRYLAPPPIGDDVAGNGTFEAPYETIGRALADGATRILCAAGVYAAGSNPIQIESEEWAEVLPEANLSVSDVIILVTDTTAGETRYRHERLKFNGVTVALESTKSWLDGEDSNLLAFENCHFESDLVAEILRPDVPIGYRSMGTYFLNCTGDLGLENWKLTSFSTTRNAYWFDGCEIVDSQQLPASSATFHLAACAINGNFGVISKEPGNPAPSHLGTHIRNNRWTRFGAPVAIRFGSEPGISDSQIAIVGNEIEKVLGVRPLCQVAADGSAAHTNDVLIIRNTFAGERINAAYQDTGSVGFNRLGWFIRHNSFRDFNIKADLFDGPISDPDGNRTGGWPVLFGVNCVANHHEISNFPQEYTAGIQLTTGDPQYVNDQSFTGGGIGGGNYWPMLTSPLIMRYPTNDTFDLNGLPNSGDVGANQDFVN